MREFVKNKKIILILIIGGVLIIAPTVLALETIWPSLPGQTPLDDKSTLPDLIKYLYEWGIALGGLAVFISLIIAGIQYLSSVGDPTSMKEATNRIQSAFLGLVLLLSSWLILNTINPDLTSFQTEPLNLQNIGAENINFQPPKDILAPRCEKIEVLAGAKVIATLKKSGDCISVSISGDKITGSIGYPDKGCMGSLQFFTSSDCSKDMIATYPATSDNVTIDQRVGSIKFF